MGQSDKRLGGYGGDSVYPEGHSSDIQWAPPTHHQLPSFKCNVKDIWEMLTVDSDVQT